MPQQGGAIGDAYASGVVPEAGALLMASSAEGAEEMVGLGREEEAVDAGPGGELGTGSMVEFRQVMLACQGGAG